MALSSAVGSCCTTKRTCESSGCGRMPVALITLLWTRTKAWSVQLSKTSCSWVLQQQ